MPAGAMKLAPVVRLPPSERMAQIECVLARHVVPVPTLADPHRNVLSSLRSSFETRTKGPRENPCGNGRRGLRLGVELVEINCPASSARITGMMHELLKNERPGRIGRAESIYCLRSASIVPPDGAKLLEVIGV